SKTEPCRSAGPGAPDTSNPLERKGTPMRGPAEYLNDPRRAMTADDVVWLICGQLFRHLTNTHLRRHSLTSESYRVQFGYNGRRALRAPGLPRFHAENAMLAELASRIRRQALDKDRTCAAGAGSGFTASKRSSRDKSGSRSTRSRSSATRGGGFP